MEYVHEAKWQGHLPGGMAVFGGGGVQAPGVLTWAAMKLYERTHDAEFLDAVYAACAQNNRWWYAQKQYDADGNGLLEWAALTSGWDNSPRWDTGPVESVDLNSWLCLDQQVLAHMATELGRPAAERDGWWRKANRTAALMQRRLWDEKEGVFFDYNGKLNRSIAVVTPVTYFALLPGVATQAQAVRMAAQLRNTSSLATPYPLPVVAASNPAYQPFLYWRGPWVPTNLLSKRKQAGLTRLCRVGTGLGSTSTSCPSSVWSATVCTPRRTSCGGRRWRWWRARTCCASTTTA